MFNYREIESEELEFISVAKVDELSNGQRLFIEIDDRPIVIFNIAGSYFAIGDVCSHDDGPLGEGEVEDTVVTCPRHGARFDIRTGKALSLPAVIDIPAYPIRIENDEILVGIPVNS